MQNVTFGLLFEMLIVLRGSIPPKHIKGRKQTHQAIQTTYTSTLTPRQQLGRLLKRPRVLYAISPRHFLTKVFQG